MAKRVTFIVLGILLILGGLGIASAGGVMLALFGTDSTLHSGKQSVSTQTHAFVSDAADISDVNDAVTAFGQPRVQINGQSDKDIFIGVGPAASVDVYLAGAAVDQVSDFDVDPFRMQTVRRDGPAQPALPASQTFWTTSAHGTSPAFDWRLRDGSYRLVVMNSDASSDVQLSAQVGLEVPHAFPIGIGTLIVGILVIAGGIVLLVASRPRRPQPLPAGPGTAGPAGQGPGSPLPGAPVAGTQYPQPNAAPYGQPPPASYGQPPAAPYGQPVPPVGPPDRER